VLRKSDFRVEVLDGDGDAIDEFDFVGVERGVSFHQTKSIFTAHPRAEPKKAET